MWEVLVCQCCSTIIAFLESEKTGTIFGHCEKCKDDPEHDE